MVEHQTKLDTPVVLPDGEIMLRIRLLEIENGVTVTRYHRTIIPPGTNPRQQMEYVNQHFALGVETKDGTVLKPKAVSEADIVKVEQKVAAEHTPDVIAKYRNDPKRKSEGGKRS